MKLLLSLGALALLAPLALVAAHPSTTATAAPASWEIDPVHTSVIFKIKHMGTTYFYGRFNKTTGKVVIDDAKPADSKVELTIDTESVDTNNDARNKHLKSADFFNAGEFPTIKFVSKTVKKADKGWKIDGELTLHGVTKPLSLDVEQVGTGDMRGTKIMGFGTSCKIKRSDFGMGNMLDALGDEVTLMIGVECQAK